MSKSLSIWFMNDTFTGALESFLTSEVAAIFEHIPGLRVEGPKRAFSRFIRRPGNFDKTVVETQRMPNGILPALLILTVKWK